MKQTQNSTILKYLKKGYWITGLKAFELCGTLCFPRRIKDIKDGLHDGKTYNLVSKIIEKKGKRFKAWKLI